MQPDFHMAFCGVYNFSWIFQGINCALATIEFTLQVSRIILSLSIFDNYIYNVLCTLRNRILDKTEVSVKARGWNQTILWCMVSWSHLLPSGVMSTKSSSNCTEMEACQHLLNKALNMMKTKIKCSQTSLSWSWWGQGKRLRHQGY
jgi:hypothetical protein